MTQKILIVEDDPAQQHMVAQLAQRKLGLGSICAANGREALPILREDNQNEIQLIILDLEMPEMDGIALLEILVEHFPKLPVIISTAKDDLDIAIKTIKMGAIDFLSKPVNPKRFEVSVRNALKMSLLEKEVRRLKHKEKGTTHFQDLIGHDGTLATVVNMGRKAASSDIPVLLTGETGVGKGIFAQAIHGESARAGKAFVAINCGAIPENLVESTLFGHEKGAFTGAVSKSPGCFREAEGGTIFLDEIGELPLEAQVKLLRVIQEKEIRPVGTDKAIPINVRIISATNRHLEQCIAEGKFRDDLFFRLNVLPIHLPPLKNRKQDIPALARHFIERFSIDENKPLRDIAPDALITIQNWHWSGNIRELENTIHRAIILCENDILDVKDFTSLSSIDFHTDHMIENIIEGRNLPLFAKNGNFKTMGQIEQDSMRMALEYHNGNIAQAARALNMSKSTFYRKLKEQESSQQNTAQI